MLYLILECTGTCAGIGAILFIAILVLWFQPNNWLFESLMYPLLCAYYYVVGVDPDDPGLDSTSSGGGEASEESGDVEDAANAYYAHLDLWLGVVLDEGEGEGGEEEEACSNSEDDNVSSEHTEFW